MDGSSLKAGEKWKDLTSGTVGTVERTDGDYVILRLRDGGAATRVQRNTLLTHWRRWPGKLDLETQERLREILRLNNVQIPPECLAKPIHVLSLYPITGGVGTSLKLAREQAERNARMRPWAIDIGTYKGCLDESQAARIKQACEEEGIPFWDKQWTTTYQVLQHPTIFPDEYADICETFGAPVPSTSSALTAVLSATPIVAGAVGAATALASPWLAAWSLPIVGAAAIAAKVLAARSKEGK